MVAFTGDIIDSARQLPILRELCSALSAKGVRIVATLGNWEHWGEVNVETLARAYADSGARLLVNESQRVEGVWMCATDDSTGGNVDLQERS